MRLSTTKEATDEDSDHYQNCDTIPRGLALIIRSKAVSYDEIVHEDVYSKLVIPLFRQLGYKVIVSNCYTLRVSHCDHRKIIQTNNNVDINLQQWYRELSEFANRIEHWDADSAIIYFRITNQKEWSEYHSIAVTEILGSDFWITSLQNKPKILFIDGPM